MPKHEFFIAGRWRNKDNVKKVLDVVRESDKTAYCFIENEYEGEKVEFKMSSDPDTFMKQSEGLEQDDPLIRKIFETDMRAEQDCESYILVLPAGIGGLIEAGVAFGMGKKCYAVGKPEKTETLYNIFEKIFPDVTELKSWLKQSN
jgi:hypothetical protein